MFKKKRLMNIKFSVIFLKTNSAVPNIAVANKIHVQNVDNFINATYTKKTS